MTRLCAPSGPAGSPPPPPGAPGIGPDRPLRRRTTPGADADRTRPARGHPGQRRASRVDVSRETTRAAGPRPSASHRPPGSPGTPRSGTATVSRTDAPPGHATPHPSGPGPLPPDRAAVHPTPHPAPSTLAALGSPTHDPPARTVPHPEIQPCPTPALARGRPGDRSPQRRLRHTPRSSRSGREGRSGIRPPRPTPFPHGKLLLQPRKRRHAPLDRCPDAHLRLGLLWMNHCCGAVPRPGIARRRIGNNHRYRRDCTLQQGASDGDTPRSTPPVAGTPHAVRTPAPIPRLASALRRARTRSHSPPAGTDRPGDASCRAPSPYAC